MIDAIIIEDEYGARESLKAIFKDYIKDVNIIAEAVNVETGIQVLRKHQPDLVFMDIRLPDGDSFQVLDQFPDATFEVIFITAYSNYLQKAFDYFSFQYLTKPVDIEKLEKTIAKYRQAKQPQFSMEKFGLLEKLLVDKPKILAIPHIDGIRVITIADIIRLEADGSYTQLFLENGEKVISTKGIGHYQEALVQYPFFRTHKSHLVDVNRIENVSFSEGIKLKNGNNVPLSQRSKKAFLAFIGK